MAKPTVLIKSMDLEKQEKFKFINKYQYITFTDLKNIAHTQRDLNKVEEVLDEFWDELKGDFETVNNIMKDIDEEIAALKSIGEELVAEMAKLNLDK